MSEDTVAAIPSYQPPEYEAIPSSTVEGYGRLEHGIAPAAPSVQLHPEGYGRLHQSSPSPRTCPQPRPPSGRRDYDECDGPPSEGYGRLEHNPPLRPKSVPLGDNRLQLDQKSPTPTRRKIPPPKPLPYMGNSDTENAVYSSIDSEEPVGMAGVGKGYNKLIRSGVSKSIRVTSVSEGTGRPVKRSSSNPDLSLSGEHYGQLEHLPQGTPSKPPAHDDYSQLQFAGEGHLSEGYGRLEHEGGAKIPVGGPVAPEQYSQLGHASPEAEWRPAFDPYGSLSSSYHYDPDNETSLFIDAGSLSLASAVVEDSTKPSVTAKPLPRKPRKPQSLHGRENGVASSHVESAAPVPRPQKQLASRPGGPDYEPIEFHIPDSPLPPLPPRRGASITTPTEDSSKPPIAPKPPLAPKPKVRPRPPA